MIVDVQFNQGTCGWPRMREAVLAAEAAGFATVWDLDHLSGSAVGGESMGECFATLAAWAAVTSRIGVGSLVTNVTNRSPGVLAVAAATVHEVSGGRFTLGLGAGAAPGSRFAAEHDALGVALQPDMSRRHEAVVEVGTAVREVLAPGRDPRFEGFPLVAGGFPVVVGANSAALAAVAGRHFDGLNIRGDHPHGDRFVAAARREAQGRPFDVSAWAFFSPERCDASHPENRALSRRGIEHLILLVRGAPDPRTVAACSRYLT